MYFIGILFKDIFNLFRSVLTKMCANSIPNFVELGFKLNNTLVNCFIFTIEMVKSWTMDKL